MRIVALLAMLCPLPWVSAARAAEVVAQGRETDVAAPVTGHLVRISFGKEPGRSGTRGDYVFFDVDWTLAPELAQRRRIEGVAILLDGDGRQRAALPWPLQHKRALGARFEEREAGWEAEQLGAIYDWLRQAPPGSVSIRYRVTPP